MHISLRTCLTFLILAIPAFAQEPSTWMEVSPKGTGFAVRFPGIPVEETDPLTKERRFEIRSGDRRYFVSSVALSPARRKTPAPPVLEKARDAFAARLSNVVMLRSEPERFQGAPALSWTLDSQEADRPPVRVKGRLVVSGGRLLTVVFADRKYSFDEPGADQWLATFRLAKP